MRTPGIADPYWYEWYVGLKSIIEMLNPDSNIVSVTFQHEQYETIDDVVVEYADKRKKVCYQVKHEISTSKQTNLTFGKLLETESNKKSLIASIYFGWVKAKKADEGSIEPILFTNRSVGYKKTNREVKNVEYTAYPLNDFLSAIKKQLDNFNDTNRLSIQDKDLCLQWEELCENIGADESSIIEFIKAFTVKYDQESLSDIEILLIKSLASSFSCSENLASELFRDLVFALRKWTTTRRKNEIITIEDVYSALSIEKDKNEAQHNLAYPTPFFDSRKRFCESIKERLYETDKKIVFISGEPGSGKTSTISYLQAKYNLFLLRYHTFKPISPQQRFYNIDEGMCSAENLWGTLLIQLREKFRGKLAKYHVPVSNKMLTIEEMRNHVRRLLGIFTEIYGRKIFICIDGIDHAARANCKPSFLYSLFLPSEIPDNVCFVIVGQPASMYKSEYPAWLLSDELKNLEHINMPKLNREDLRQLILSSVAQLSEACEGLSSFIFNCTQGNNLSAVYAVEEIKNCQSIEAAFEKLNNSGITDDIQQYYNHLWAHASNLIRAIGLNIAFPESIIASSILLMNGRVNIRILSRALSTYNISKCDWKLILDSLSPVVAPSGASGEDEYSLFHNDFRVFLMGIISSVNPRYEEIALLLAKDLMENDEGLLTYVLGIPLLRCANKCELITNYFTSDFVINALAAGISQDRLNEYANLAYCEACKSRDLDLFINVYLAIKTYHQHKRYFEYYEKEYNCCDSPELENLNIAEIRTLPLTKSNLIDYENALALCIKLYSSNIEDGISRANRLYNIWFEGMSPYSLLPICCEEISEEKDWELNQNEVGLFLNFWGESAAKTYHRVSKIPEPRTKLEKRALLIFGNGYFNKCLELGFVDFAFEAADGGYVSQKCFIENLEQIYYKKYAKKFEEFLIHITDTEEKTWGRLLALAIKSTLEENFKCEATDLIIKNDIKNIYENNSFLLVLVAFLTGSNECALDDAVVCSHIKENLKSLDEHKLVVNQITKLSVFAALLGKYYWNPERVSKVFNKILSWFLTTKLIRGFEYSKARNFLLYTFLDSKISAYLAHNEAFIKDLKVSLFELDSLGNYFKVHILDYFVEIDRLDVVKDYILALYGEDGKNLCLDEFRNEAHHIFCKYGALVMPNLMDQVTNNLKWDVVGYVGHKEYIMQGLSDLFEKITDNFPEKWKDYGIRLYKQSEIAKIAGNEYAYDIRNNVIKAAVKSGYKQFWELCLLDEDFRMDPDVIYHSLFAFIDHAKNEKDLKLIWLCNCGIHSWYTDAERNATINIYYACKEKGVDLGINFNQLVFETTPNWLPIIEYKEKQGASERIDEYTLKHNKEKEAIVEEYTSRSAISVLKEDFAIIPAQSSQPLRYRVLMDLLQKDKLVNFKTAEVLLKSVCIYIKDSLWHLREIQDIVVELFNVLGTRVFWEIAQIIGNYLSEYNYQSSVTDIQELLSIALDFCDLELQNLFEKELSTQEKWITGNNHIKIDEISLCSRNTFSRPDSMTELILNILLAQIESQNARKIEVVIYSIYLLGKFFEETQNSIASRWEQYSDLQKDFLLIPIARWEREEIICERLIEILNNEYQKCNQLTRKYYLHTILINRLSLAEDKIDLSAEAESYTLPLIGDLECTSLSFFKLSNKNDDILRFIKQNSAIDTYVEDAYEHNAYFRIPDPNRDVERILYAKEKEGRWSEIPLSIKKCHLIYNEDIFMLTEMPRIIYDETWFPPLPDEYRNKTKGSRLGKNELLKIATSHLQEGESVLAACIWYPWNNKDGVISKINAKVCAKDCFYTSQELNLSMGNFGLLSKYDILDEYREEYLDYGGINLFNESVGKMRFTFSNSQFVPSAFMQLCFGCEPKTNNPYIWYNENGVEVLRFEKVSSPMRSLIQEQYTRQPILFRWICHEQWLNEKLKQLGLNLWFVSNTAEMNNE